MTNNFNLTELMEKRVRSRFSQKTMFITIKSYEDIILTMQIMFGLENNNNSSLTKEEKDGQKLLKDFFQVLIRNELFIQLIISQVNKGFSVKQILTKIKYILACLLFEIQKSISKTVTYEDIQKILNTNLTLIKEEEYFGSYSLLLKSKSYLLIYRLRKDSYSTIDNFD
jgi:hypothetical protein